MTETQRKLIQAYQTLSPEDFQRYFREVHLNLKPPTKEEPPVKLSRKIIDGAVKNYGYSNPNEVQKLPDIEKRSIMNEYELRTRPQKQSAVSPIIKRYTSMTNSLITDLDRSISSISNRLQSYNYRRNPLDKAILGQLQRMRTEATNIANTLVEGKLNSEQKKLIKRLNFEFANIEKITNDMVKKVAKSILKKRVINPKTGRLYTEEEAQQEAINFLSTGERLE